MSSCTRETNKVCEVYVHNVLVTAKIDIACGQMPFVFVVCYQFQILKIEICSGRLRKLEEFVGRERVVRGCGSGAGGGGGVEGTEGRAFQV